jgi:hypothetical protein
MQFVFPPFLMAYNFHKSSWFHADAVLLKHKIDVELLQLIIIGLLVIQLLTMYKLEILLKELCLKQTIVRIRGIKGIWHNIATFS